MTSNPTFAELLASFVQRDGRHVRQLEVETANQFGSNAKVPHNTISRWQRGEVQRPRSWQDVLKLAAVLKLTEQEANDLLQTAGQPTFSSLKGQGQQSEQALFDCWQKPTQWEPPFQLPPQITTFVGREDVAATVTKVLCSQSNRRVCCLLGMAGLGKTSLANYLGYTLRQQFADGVLWVQLENSDLMSALDSIALSFNNDISQYNDVGTRSSKVRELLANKQALLILDNAEADEQIRPLLPPSGPCAVLITSRRHDLALTDDAFRITLTPFKPENRESIRLFAQILGEQKVTQEEAIYGEIATLLGHLPLAISIIAHRLLHEPGWTAAELLARLQQTEQRLDLLQRGDQQVRLSFMLSYQALTPADQQLFASLGIFASETFAATAAAAINQQPIFTATDGLRRLFALSLLQSGRHNRYRLHPLLRDFSRKQCQDADLPARYTAYYLQYVQDNAQDEAALQAELSNILDAIGLAVEDGSDTAVISSGLALYPYLQQRGLFDQAIELLKGIESIARRDQKNPGSLIQIVQNLGYIAMKQGKPEQAEPYYQEALSLAKSGSNDQQTAEILLKLGALAYRRGQINDAETLCQEGLQIARRVQADELIASFLANLGLVAASSGDLKAAIALYEEALPLARQTGNRPLTINLLQNLGNQLEARGDYALAKGYFEEGLDLAESANDPELRSRMLGNLGLVACQLGNHAEAAAHFRSGLKLAEKNQLTIQIYRQQANLGHVAALRGQYRQANAHYRQSLDLVRDLNFPEDYAMILNQTGDCYLAQDLYPEAESCFAEAYQLAQNSNLTRVLPMSLFGLAQVAAARGNVSEAAKLGQESRELLKAAGHKKADDVWWWLKELPGEVLEKEG